MMIGSSKALAFLPLFLVAILIANAVDAARTQQEYDYIASHCPLLINLNKEALSNSEHANNIELLESDCDKCCKHINFLSGKIFEGMGKSLRSEMNCYCEKTPISPFSMHKASREGFVIDLPDLFKNWQKYENAKLRANDCKKRCKETGIIKGGHCRCELRPMEFFARNCPDLIELGGGGRSTLKYADDEVLVQSKCTECCRAVNFKSGFMRENCVCATWSKEEISSANYLMHKYPGLELDLDDEIEKLCGHLDYDGSDSEKYSSDPEQRFIDCDRCCQQHIGIIYNGECKCFAKTEQSKEKVM